MKVSSGTVFVMWNVLGNNCNVSLQWDGKKLIQSEEIGICVLPETVLGRIESALLRGFRERIIVHNVTAYGYLVDNNK